MRVKTVFLTALALLLGSPCRSESASVASIDPADLLEYESQPDVVKDLIESALSLTRKKLAYTFGSNSPSNAGMDCSGTVQHTLKTMELGEIPRSSYAMYHWVKDSGNLTDTPGVSEISDPVFENLKPGDLLFWTGTHTTSGRVPPISHVMIYLGTLKEDGKGVVFGASSGRRYRGKKIHGVSVFDWKVPSKSSKAKFVGFGPIPGLVNELEATEVVDETAQKQKKGLKSALEFLFKKSDASDQ